MSERALIPSRRSVLGRALGAMAIGGVVAATALAIATPAGAHEVLVSGQAPCVAADGSWQVHWTARNSQNDVMEIQGSDLWSYDHQKYPNQEVKETSPTFAPTTVPGLGTATAVTHHAAAIDEVLATVTVTWHTGSEILSHTGWSVLVPRPTEVCGTAEVGSVTLDKVVSGPAGSVPTAGTTYGFTVNCGTATSVSMTAEAGPATVASGVPVGTPCTITETETRGADATTIAVAGGAPVAGTSRTVTVASGTTAVVVANTFDADVLPGTPSGPTGPTTPVEVLPLVIAPSQAVASQQLPATGRGFLPLALGGVLLLTAGALTAQVGATRVVRATATPGRHFRPR